MNQEISVHFVNRDFSVFLEILNHCPVCNETMFPLVLNAKSTDYIGENHSENGKIGLLLQCTSCNSFFCRQYTVIFDDVGFPQSTVEDELHIGAKPNVNIPDNIQKLSPDFVNIYTQALTAKVDGLDELVGIGLRKALEYLVTDYAISQNPDNEEAILKQTLGKKIQDYLDSARLTTISETAAWIGNDETHPFRKHPSKDVDDLKQIVDLFVKELDTNIQFNEVAQFHDNVK